MTGHRWYCGNAAEDGTAHRGWIVGSFIDPTLSGRSTADVEVKWGSHPAGQRRATWAPGGPQATLVILVQGRFRVDLVGGSAILVRQGDYVTWGPGTEHSWYAEADSVVITIRWPSLPT
jgi:hypothetical protein